MNETQLTRYSKNIFLPEIDLDGQETLLASSALIIGLGGIGALCATYLAASGVGTLYLCDDDHIDLTNLGRQITYNQTDIGKTKSQQIKTNIQLINQDTVVHTQPNYTPQSPTRKTIAKSDIILDCSDNFDTRFLINHDAHAKQTTHIMASAIGFKAQVATFKHPSHACYNCLYDKQHATHNPFPENCGNSGIFAPAAATAATITASECIKTLCGMGADLIDTLLLIDLTQTNFKKTAIPKDTQCPTCSKK